MNTTHSSSALKVARLNWIAARKGGITHLYNVYKYNREILPRAERASRRTMRRLYGLTIGELNALASLAGLTPVR